MTLLERQKEMAGALVVGCPALELRGFPLVSACAVTGNYSQENLVQPVTTGVKDHGSDGAGQWRLDRLEGPHGLKGWAEFHGLDWKRLDTQAWFTIWELENDARYAGLLKGLREGRKKIETLTANFCWLYERPAQSAAHLEKRISHAKSVYQVMSREQSSAGAATASATVVIGSAGAAAVNAGLNGNGLHTLAVLGFGAAASAVLALISERLKAGAREAAPELARQLDPIDTVVPRGEGEAPTAALDAATARRKAAEAALADALNFEEGERRKVVERLDALKSAIEASAVRAPTPVQGVANEAAAV